MTADSSSGPGLIHLPTTLLLGEGLEPYSDGVHAPGFLEVVKPHPPGQSMLTAFSGQIWVAVYDYTGGETRIVFLPGDEFVYVLEGAVTLDPDDDGDAVTFAAGEFFFIPKGWHGTWSSDGRYRELAVCSDEWLVPYTKAFRREIRDSERRTTVVSIDPDRAESDLPLPSDAFPGGQNTFRRADIQGSDLSIRLLACDGGSPPMAFPRQDDEFVIVLGGSVTVTAEPDCRETFGPRECFVVSEAFRGTWAFSAGCRALVVKAGDHS